MANLVKNSMYFGAFLHSIFAIFVYGNENIFNDTTKG